MTPQTNQNAHDLMPDSLSESIPPLYATENESDPIATVKLFSPNAAWTWYILEIDSQAEICFGFVEGLERELGYFSLDEIKQARGPMGLKVERDLHFSPTPLTELYPELERGR